MSVPSPVCYFVGVVYGGYKGVPLSYRYFLPGPASSRPGAPEYPFHNSYIKAMVSGVSTERKSRVSVWLAGPAYLKTAGSRKEDCIGRFYHQGQAVKLIISNRPDFLGARQRDKKRHVSGDSRGMSIIPYLGIEGFSPLTILDNVAIISNITRTLTT